MKGFQSFVIYLIFLEQHHWYEIPPKYELNNCIFLETNDAYVLTLHPSLVSVIWALFPVVHRYYCDSDLYYYIHVILYS